MFLAYKGKEKSFVRKRWQNSNRIHLNRSTCTCTGQILSDLKSKIWDNGICPRFQWLACIFSDFRPKIKWLVSKYTVINTCVFLIYLVCVDEKKNSVETKRWQHIMKHFPTINLPILIKRSENSWYKPLKPKVFRYLKKDKI